MINGDEWKGAVAGKPARRESPAVPSAGTAPKWTTDETAMVELAYEASKGSAQRFVARYNAETEGRQRTPAELQIQLERVAEARGLAVPRAFMDALDALIDGVPIVIVEAAAPQREAAETTPTKPQPPKERAEKRRAAPVANPAPKQRGRVIVCDVCGGPIREQFPPDRGPSFFFGMLTWNLEDKTLRARDFRIVHKGHCDNSHDPHHGRYWMELGLAIGPHGIGTLVHFMAEDTATVETRREIEQLIHRLYLTDDRLDPPATAFNRRFDDPLHGYEH